MKKIILKLSNNNNKSNCRYNRIVVNRQFWCETNGFKEYHLEGNIKQKIAFFYYYYYLVKI